MRALIVLSVGLAGVFACGEPTVTTAPTLALQPMKKTVVDAGVSLTTSEPYQYSYVSMGKRDPFRGSLAGPEEGTKGPQDTNTEGCDEPLCQFDLDDLRLVAVVSGDANPVAMVEDRSGVGHVVRRNTKVGKQAGKVTAILRECIVVTSFVVGPDGRAQPNRQNLCVSTEGQATSPILDLMNGKARE